MGLFILPPPCGTVNPNLGLDPADAALGDDGAAAPLELVRRDDGDRFIIFSPSTLFTRLVTAIPTPGCLAGDPGAAAAVPSPPGSEEL